MPGLCVPWCLLALACACLPWCVHGLVCACLGAHVHALVHVCLCTYILCPGTYFPLAMYNNTHKVFTSIHMYDVCFTVSKLLSVLKKLMWDPGLRKTNATPALVDDFSWTKSRLVVAKKYIVATSWHGHFSWSMRAHGPTVSRPRPGNVWWPFHRGPWSIHGGYRMKPLKLP